MRRTLAVVVLVLWTLIGLPGTTHAGGPTSVLITVPATGGSGALYVTSGEYADLERTLAADPGSPTSAPPAGSGVADYNLTWLIHDVQPWRIDNVHITGDGRAYVATTFVSDPAEITQEGSWREVARPKELAAILDRALSGARSNVAPQPVLDDEAAAAPAVPAATTTRWFSLAGWRWVVPGVLAGLLVGLVVGLVARLVVGHHRGPGESRRVLVDRAPEHACT